MTHHGVIKIAIQPSCCLGYSNQNLFCNETVCFSTIHTLQLVIRNINTERLQDPFAKSVVYEWWKVTQVYARRNVNDNTLDEQHIHFNLARRHA